MVIYSMSKTIKNSDPMKFPISLDEYLKKIPQIIVKNIGKVAVNVKYKQIHSKIHKVIDFVYFLYLKKYVY
jgi:hypothetical protein